jgi:YVTN family beta-propeller protein
MKSAVRMRVLITALSCGICGLTSATDPSHSSLPLEVLADAPLTGRTTRWDYASLDASKHRLYLAHLGDSAMVVFDTQRREVLKEVRGLSHVHGVLAIPELERIYVSATARNEVVAVADGALEIRARIPVGEYPDGLSYAPGVRKLYVSNEYGNSVTVIDVASDKRVATIALGGEAGNTQYDPASRHVFVNVQTRAQLAEIDTAVDKVIERIDLPGAEANHGLLIDPEGRRAFISCEGNDRLLVLDLRTRKIIGSFSVGREPDVLALDAGLHYLYVAGEAGIVSVFDVAKERIAKMGEGLLGPNAHVVSVDSASHEGYFPLKDVGGRPTLRITRPRGCCAGRGGS